MEIVENARHGRKLSGDALDVLCRRRKAIEQELGEINQTLKDQVEEHGFTPARAEKSKRLAGAEFEVTLSYGETTEIRDAQVEVIEKLCPQPLFEKLFTKVTKYKLARSATMLLSATLPAGAPSNLRKLFAAAVVLKSKAPSLSVKRVGEEES